MGRVVHFEIHADDPARACNFYRDIFGWKIEQWGGPADYWLITTGPKTEPGIDGAITKRQGLIDGQAVIAYVCTIDVPSLDATLDKVMAHGGTLALPKMAVATVGWLAYCKDTEGNIFGIMQADPSAK